MTGVTGQWSLLPIACHPGIHQAGIALTQVIWADAKPLGHAGPVHVHESVGVVGQPLHEFPAPGVFDVGGQRPLAAPHRVVDG